MRRWVPLILLLLSAATHWLWLAYPREVVFDEVHFGKFVTAYCCTGQRFFDIHPPHAKLLIAAAAKLGGYQGGFSFDHIGQPYGPVSPLPFRAVPALTGTILPLIIYVLLRQLGISQPGALFGGLLIVLDNALTIQTRIIALDGLLLVATFGSLSAYLAAERAIRERQYWLPWALLAGALAGLAVGTKFTGLLALGLLGLLIIWRLVKSGSKNAAGQWLTVGLTLLLAAAAVYLTGWVVHFMLLTQPGSGDAWGVPVWDRPLLVSFWRELVRLHITMYTANNGLTIVHHDSSPWWGWPFMSNPVFYWQKAATEATAGVGAIYFIGNPLVWMGSTVLLLTTVVWSGLTLLSGRAARPFTKSWFVIPLVGYGLSLWPLTRVARGLFLYHYLTPLLFAILLGVGWLDHHGWFGQSLWPLPRRVYLSLAAVALFFIFFSPLTYGWRLHPDTQALLFWFSSWR